jgi:hypothetical protein
LKVFSVWWLKSLANHVKIFMSALRPVLFPFQAFSYVIHLYLQPSLHFPLPYHTLLPSRVPLHLSNSNYSLKFRFNVTASWKSWLSFQYLILSLLTVLPLYLYLFPKMPSYVV